LEAGSVLDFDISGSETNKTDSLNVDGNLVLAENSVFNIRWNTAEEAQEVAPGEYRIIAFSGDFSGDLSKIKISGLEGKSYKLKEVDGAVVLEIKDMRQAATISGDGTNANTGWDLKIHVDDMERWV
jgi:hypothetical protein